MAATDCCHGSRVHVSDMWHVIKSGGIPVCAFKKKAMQTDCWHSKKNTRKQSHLLWEVDIGPTNEFGTALYKCWTFRQACPRHSYRQISGYQNNAHTLHVNITAGSMVFGGRPKGQGHRSEFRVFTSYATFKFAVFNTTTQLSFLFCSSYILRYFVHRVWLLLTSLC